MSKPHEAGADNMIIASVRLSSPLLHQLELQMLLLCLRAGVNATRSKLLENFHRGGRIAT